MRIFKIYPDEVKLLLWIMMIQFLMRISSVLINNYAQTAFLKRYGVEYLPTVFLINAILVFVIINILGVLMDRFRATRVFTGILLFFALSVGVIWILLPLNITVVYPILFILKTEATTTLPLLYWNIMNNLFTSRQAKRLFTLLTAGGILGATLGNFLTGDVARWVGVDNVILIFVGGMVVAAFMNERIEWILGTPIQARKGRLKKKQGSLKEILQEVYAHSKRSPFLKFMILIVGIPNVVLPILVYQFNVVVDITYATEQATIQFFGLFRGISNAVIFLFLMISGRLLSRWGVATGLLFHPINYLFAFASLFLRFDIFSGIYARFSTEALKTTINNPARAVLYNFFPSHVRGKIQVFLRGSVAKAAGLAGSGLLILSKGVVEPQMLSLVAAPLVLIWIGTNLLIKKRYASMLIQVLMEQQIDWRHLEDVNLKQLAQDKNTIRTLQQGLRDDNPEIVTLCAEILGQVAPDGWMNWVVESLPGKPAEVQRQLLLMLRPEEAEEVMSDLLSLARKTSAETLALMIPTLSRLKPKGNLKFIESLVERTEIEVRSQALVALYRSDEPGARSIFRQHVERFLNQAAAHSIRVALEILAETGDPSFSKDLLHWAKSEPAELKALALRGLSKMRLPEALTIAAESIDDPSPQVREACAQVMIESGEEKAPLEGWIHLLADEDPQVRETVVMAVRGRGEGVAKRLIPFLASPSRALRNEVLAILDELEAPPVELTQFITREMTRAYLNLACIKSLEPVKETNPATAVLMDHLSENNNEILETVLRVLAVQELGDRMEIIRRALQTGRKTDVDNAIEALESSLHTGIRRSLIPLLEEIPLDEKLAVGKKAFDLQLDGTQSPETIFMALLQEDDPITQVLTLFAVAEGFWSKSFEPVLYELADSKDQMVRNTVQWTRYHLKLDAPEARSPEDGLSLLEKVMHIRKIPMFADLRIRELMAIANIARETDCPKGKVAVREGDQGDVLYLVLEGELSVIKDMGSNRVMKLDEIKAGDFFGEMALFDAQPRAASVSTDSNARLLVIGGAAFSKMMEHYPAIPINVCKVFSERTRSLHERYQDSTSNLEG
jgi:HEAT repeat protein